MSGNDMLVYWALKDKEKQDAAENKKREIQNQIENLKLQKEPKEDPISKIEKLKELLDIEAITLEEYNIKKEELLRLI